MKRRRKVAPIALAAVAGTTCPVSARGTRGAPAQTQRVDLAAAKRVVILLATLLRANKPAAIPVQP